MRNQMWWATSFRPALCLLGVLLAGEKEAPQNDTSIRFSEHLIADKYGYAYGLAAADLDGDGDLDLTSQDVRGKPSQSSLFWFENDGRGTFQRHVIHEDEPGWFERHAVGDITGDGKPDVAVVNNRDGHLVWFALGDRPGPTKARSASGSDQPEPTQARSASEGSPPAGLWKRYVITTKCPRAYDVVLADLDGDGDLDAAAAGYASNRFTWYENPGQDGWDREWTQYEIDEKMSEARTIRAGDFNRDGKVDLLGAAVGAENIPLDVVDVKDHGSSVVWYENPGTPPVPPLERGGERGWKKHVIDDRSRAPIHGHPTDLDGDGDLDVLMALGMRKALVPEDRHEVVWYENPGTPPVPPLERGGERGWKKHKIGDLPSAFEAFASDLDGDGDIDAVATAWAKGDRLVWFENQGDPRGKWTVHVLKENWYAANQVIVADLNGDRRPDIAATADDGSSRVAGANELRWWRNEGRPGSE